jgi:hypothetical protein
MVLFSRGGMIVLAAMDSNRYRQDEEPGRSAVYEPPAIEWVEDIEPVGVAASCTFFPGGPACAPIRE